MAGNNDVLGNDQIHSNNAMFDWKINNFFLKDWTVPYANK